MSDILMMNNNNDDANSNNIEQAGMTEDNGSTVTPGPTPIDIKASILNTTERQEEKQEEQEEEQKQQQEEETLNAQEMTDAIYSVHSQVNEAMIMNDDVNNDEKAEAVSTIVNEASSNNPVLVKEQIKYCQRILKGLKRHRDAGPFLLPVDPVALNIPDYFTVIKQPMDLSAISKKCDLNDYATAEAFMADVRLMLTNCFTYNAPESQVTKMGRSLEKYFNTAMAKMPTDLINATAVGASGSSLIIDSPTSGAARPKRESVSAAGRRQSSTNSSSASSSSPSSSVSLTFCSSVLRELMKKTNAHLNWPFMIPVDPVALNIPDYFDVVKQPMDFSTIRKKLDTGAYARADQFESDVRLVFSNCYTYNPTDSDVCKMARELEAIFEQKMAQKPAPKSHSNSSINHHHHHNNNNNNTNHSSANNSSSMASSASGMSQSVNNVGFIPSSASQLIPGLDSLEDDSEKILAINHQIQILQAELNFLLLNRKSSSSSSASLRSDSHASLASRSGAAPAARAPKKKAPSALNKSAASSSTSGSSSAAAATVSTASSANQNADQMMSFEEKRQLSEDVSNLPQDNMMRVLEIIQECMPNLHSNGDSDVIELDIEALDLRTLRALQNYIWECKNPGAKKRKPNAINSINKKSKPESSETSASASNNSASANNYGGIPSTMDNSSSSSDEDDD